MNEPDFTGIVLKWWASLEKDKGARAELRRAGNVTEVAFSSAYHRLYNELPKMDKEGLASIAGLCAHIKEHRGGLYLAEQMAEGDVSGLRFRRLLAMNDRNELYHAMIRIIRLLDGVVNICSLSSTVYWWNEQTKKRLAYDYYAKANKE